VTGASPGKLRQLNGNGKLFIGNEQPWKHGLLLPCFGVKKAESWNYLYLITKLAYTIGT
jgi:hypothetical protein